MVQYSVKLSGSFNGAGEHRLRYKLKVMQVVKTSEGDQKMKDSTHVLYIMTRRLS